jgi:hypothetical protein
MDVVCKSVCENISKDVDATFDRRRLLFQRVRALKNLDMAKKLAKEFQEAVDEIDKKLKEIDESKKDVTVYAKHFKHPRVFERDLDDVEIRMEFTWEVGVCQIPDIRGAKLKNSERTDVRLFADMTGADKYVEELKKKYNKARFMRMYE